MKKIVLLALLFAPVAMYAQGFQLGVKGGVNVSIYTGGDIESDALVGFHVGGFMNFKLGSVVSLQPEVLFSSQGAKIKGSGITDDQNIRVSYINVPVLLKLKSAGGFYVEAGPQVGFKAGDDFDGGQSVDNFAKNLDFSLAAGLGFHSSMGLGIGARYNAGISKVGDFDETALRNPDYKNSVIQVSVFYTLFNNK